MQQDPDSNYLVYIHDPMCSWCWAFSKSYAELTAGLPDEVNLMRVVGGLAPDSDEPMTEEMKGYLSKTWASIQVSVPGTQFNFDFWTKCQPRRSTYPACRAVIAARAQGDEWDLKMTQAIQHAYYLDARNPSDNSTLIAIADEIGLDKSQFTKDLLSPETQQTLVNEIDLSRRLGVQGFPSLVLLKGHQGFGIPVDHNYVDDMLSEINILLG